MLLNCRCILIACALFHVALASNILGLFPHFGYSHFKVFYPIVAELARRGHNVTVVTYIKSPDAIPHYEELLIKTDYTTNVFEIDRFSPYRSLWDIINEYFLLHDEGQLSCEHFYASGFVEEILERHKRTPYDLVITEFFNTDCYLGVPYMLQVPVVGLSSCVLMPWYYDRILLPDTPSHVQSEFVGFPERLNWQQRLLNFVQSRLINLLYRYRTNYYDSKVIKKYLNVDVDVREYAKISTSLILVNQHYSLSGNRPSTAQLIEIGGIHIDERRIAEQKLPQEIENFLAQAQHGVLVISWGSMLRSSSMDPAKLQVVIKALQKLPLKVIWKWEDDKKPIESEQFLFVKWVPQATLLCHSKVKYFWGHGGLLGTTEALHCGKPSILTPIYGDQFCNANAVHNRKIGIMLHYHDINEKHVKYALQEIMRPRYAENAAALSKIFRNRPASPLATSTWWIEHLLQHGKIARKALHTEAVHLNWIVYYSLDTIILLVCSSALFVLLLRKIIQLTYFRHQERDKFKRD